jgi:hypothetical protein
MNTRTAERDRVTPFGACFTLGVGARVRTLGEHADTDGLGYSARAGNLADTLALADVRVDAQDALAKAFCLPTTNASGNGGTLQVGVLPDDPALADAAIGVVRKQIDRDHGLLIVVSPNPSPENYNRFDRLTPVVLYGESVKQGLAVSPSTHTPGLVTNTDIAPTVAAYFGAKLVGPSYGQPVKYRKAAEAPMVRLEAWNQQWIAQERALGLRPYIAAGLAVIVLLLTWSFMQESTQRAGGVLVTLTVLAMSLTHSPPALSGLWCVAAVVSVIAVKSQRSGLSAAATVTALYFFIDAILFQGSVSGASLLGYSPIEGARYYGIGNEAMGAFIGAMLIVAGWLASRRQNVVAIGLLVVAAVVLGHPHMGAKAGGLLVGLIATAAFAWGLSGKRFKLGVALSGVIAAVTIGVVALALLAHSGDSHVSRVLGEGSTSEIFLTATRKLAMNVHLVFHSVWIWVLGAASVGSRLVWKRSAIYPPSDRATVTGLACATAACLALNDAGVVAAAICALYLWSFTMSVSRPLSVG